MTLSIHLAGASDMSTVADLCRAYRETLIARSEDTPEFVARYYGAGAFETLLKELPQKHARPDGAIFLACKGDAPVGCAMTHRIDIETCEIKRVYVAPEARGLGAGRALFEAAMAQARADGYVRMVLDTFHTLAEAIELYGKLGFAETPPFYPPDRELGDKIRFYARPL
ncbi:MAG: GNAT family N-acetyltransferase [Pseudomonadota bacterium]